ncbi:aldehyde ferredoxin oxidoreductase family protein [Chloroflexota bacterium]
MEYCGYVGKILHVDLTTRRIREEVLDTELARSFIGDYGISASLAYDLIKPGIDPLLPENVILFGAGPLAGTSAPGAGRCHFFTKLPLTGTVAGGGGGQGFSSRLKYAGYDELVITGHANSPVYLKILDGDVELIDAADLWGEDIYQTTDRLWEKHGSSCSVLAIGQAGENLANLSLALVNKGSTIGRGGLGAVMGSKNLKAIVANGRRGIKVYDRRRFRGVVNQVMADVRAYPKWHDIVRLSHLIFDFDRIMSHLGFTNYLREFPDLTEVREVLGPEVYLKRIKIRRIACFSCPMACHDISELKGGTFSGVKFYSHGLTPILAVRLGIDSMDGNIKCRELIGRYGLDYFGLMGQIEYARELYQQGIITKDDTGGIEFKPGLEAMKDLIEKITFRKGIGDVLADGLSGVEKKFGKECEQYCLHTKGMDTSEHPVISKLGAKQIDEVTGVIGPTHKGGMINPGKFEPSASLESFIEFGDKAAIPKEAMNRILDTPMKLNIGRLTRYTQDYYAIMSSLGLCIRAHMNWLWPMSRMADIYSAATGIEITASQLQKAGERIHNVAKMLNVREGFSRKDDKFPSTYFKPLKTREGEKPLMDHFETKVLTKEDLESLLDDYYDERGWDVKKGIPTPAKLIELGLDRSVADLNKA